MNYRQIRPHPALNKYVRHFGIFDSGDEPSVARTFKIIVDGCPGLIFQEHLYSFQDEHQKFFPRIFLHGLATKHSHKTTRGQFRNLGVYFHPHGLKSVFGINAHELTDTYVDFSSICSIDLSDKLLRTESIEERIDILTSFLIKKVEKNTCNHYVGSVLTHFNHAYDYAKKHARLFAFIRAIY